MSPDAIRQFAADYTAAWCSQDPDRVAAFFGEHGSLTINAGTPATGRAQIATSARGFMEAFPDLVVRMDAVEPLGATIAYRWTLTGTNTGPGGTGRCVAISGHEAWTFGDDGLIARSLGYFDANAYDRQLHAGAQAR